MGSTSFYPEEAPVHTATVGAFAVERHPVTNAQFAEFVADTGYVTVAEQPLDPALYPGCRPPRSGARRAGVPAHGRPGRSAGLAAVVGLGAGRVLAAPVRAGAADWDFADRPTIRWCRSPIPTRRPMRGGRGGGCRPRPSGSTRRAAAAPPPTPWGDDVTPGGRTDGQHLAGPVPVPQRRRAGLGGHLAGRGTFPPNGFGLVDMIGNVWEWTTTEFSAHHRLDGPAKAAARRRGRPIRPSIRPSRADRICARRSTATGTGPR